MTTPTALALWLSRHTDAIACDEAAGELSADIKAAVEQIERVINRPIPPRDLGPCPTIVSHHQTCATRLSAPRRDTEVTCPNCKATHSVEQLMGQLRHELKYWPLSAVEILGSRTSDLPGALDYYEVTLPRSTFYHWRKNGLPVRGYRNTETLAVLPHRENETDEPVFWLADVFARMGVDVEQRAG